MKSTVQRYFDGEPPESFNPVEAKVLAEELMARPEFKDHKHRHHQVRSEDVRQLFQIAAPGHIGAGGEVVGGRPDESLFQ